ncbi:hypothetical protein, partial [Sinomonas soli]
MDLQAAGGLLTAIGGLLGVVGGGVAWMVNRADKRREQNEANVIATLKERIEELKAALRRAEQKVHALRRTAGRWREQLIAHNITPDPADW